jgi:hypothetical protein
MGMSADFIRKEYSKRKSRTNVQSNHNEIVRIHKIYHHTEEKKF